MIKKIVSCIIALCVAGSMSISTYAYDVYVPESEVTSDSSGIMPLYDNASYVGAGININSSNKAICSGSYSLYSKKKSVITMELMKSTDGKTNWSVVETWTKTNTVQNPAGFSKTSTNALSSSYYYCTYVQVQIYDSNDNVIETVSCFSNTCHL